MMCCRYLVMGTWALVCTESASSVGDDAFRMLLWTHSRWLATGLPATLSSKSSESPCVYSLLHVLAVLLFQVPVDWQSPSAHSGEPPEVSLWKAYSDLKSGPPTAVLTLPVGKVTEGQWHEVCSQVLQATQHRFEGFWFCFCFYWRSLSHRVAMKLWIASEQVFGGKLRTERAFCMLYPTALLLRLLRRILSLFCILNLALDLWSSCVSLPINHYRRPVPLIWIMTVRSLGKSLRYFQTHISVCFSIAKI